MIRARIRIATIPPVPKIVKARSMAVSLSQIAGLGSSNVGGDICRPGSDRGLRPESGGVAHYDSDQSTTLVLNATKSTLAPPTQRASVPARITRAAYYLRRAQDTWNGPLAFRNSGVVHPRIMRHAAPRCISPTSGPVLPRFLVRRLGPVGVAVTVYDLWRHLPAKRRQQLLDWGRKHGTRAARFVIKQRSAQMRKRRR